MGTSVAPASPSGENGKGIFADGIDSLVRLMGWRRSRAARALSRLRSCLRRVLPVVHGFNRADLERRSFKSGVAHTKIRCGMGARGACTVMLEREQDSR